MTQFIYSENVVRFIFTLLSWLHVACVILVIFSNVNQNFPFELSNIHISFLSNLKEFIYLISLSIAWYSFGWDFCWLQRHIDITQDQIETKFPQTKILSIPMWNFSNWTWHLTALCEHKQYFYLQRWLDNMLNTFVCEKMKINKETWNKCSPSLFFPDSLSLAFFLDSFFAIFFLACNYYQNMNLLVDFNMQNHKLWQSCNGLVAMLFQQLVNRMCSHCLFPACWQVVNGLSTTCYKVVELNTCFWQPCSNLNITALLQLVDKLATSLLRTHLVDKFLRVYIFALQDY